MLVTMEHKKKCTPFKIKRNSITYMKGTPMSKKEVHLLLDLVASKPILTSKNTKASVNKLKRRAWIEIEAEFNNKNDKFRPRDQLSLRWANLKKTYRKKNKTTGGKTDLSEQDVIMDRVLSLLEGSTAICDTSVDMGCDEVSDSGSCSIDENDTNGHQPMGDAEGGYTDRIETHKRIGGRENVIRERNLTMAKYFEKKAQLLDIEIKLLKLELLNKKRRLIEDVVDI